MKRELLSFFRYKFLYRLLESSQSGLKVNAPPLPNVSIKVLRLQSEVAVSCALLLLIIAETFHHRLMMFQILRSKSPVQFIIDHLRVEERHLFPAHVGLELYVSRALLN